MPYNKPKKMENIQTNTTQTKDMKLLLAVERSKRMSKFLFASLGALLSLFMISANPIIFKPLVLISSIWGAVYLANKFVQKQLAKRG